LSLVPRQDCGTHGTRRTQECIRAYQHGSQRRPHPSYAC
jgi:hypothetical protein